MRRTIELNQLRDTVAQRDTEIHRLGTEIVADEGKHRFVGTPACSSHDTSGKARNGLTPARQAAHDPLRQKLAASVSYDLWRFSCEMPDAPHLSEARLNRRGEEQSQRGSAETEWENPARGRNTRSIAK
jgi:hypothetical protein